MEILTRVLPDNVREFGEYPYLYDGHRVYTNREVLNESEQLARILTARGLKTGDRVLVSMPNRPEVLFIYQAVMLAGAIVVPVLFMLGVEEMTHIIEDAEPRAIFTDIVTAEKIAEAVKKSGRAPDLWSVDDGPPGFLRANDFRLPSATHELGAVSEGDIAVILYTSGTTGTPKGVMLTHKNLYANARQVRESSDLGDRSVTLGVLPLAHIFGFTVSTITAMVGGSVVVFRKFEVQEVFAAIERHRVRTFSAVPAMLYAMVTSPLASQYDLSSLETVSSGSAPCPVTLIEAFQERFHADVLEGYGLSEAAPVVSGHRRGMPIKPGTVGVLVSGVEARILDRGGNAMPSGEVGELWVRGDNITPGYYRNSKATEEVLDEGWLATGDLARMDADGYLSIVDRKKDLIIRGGYNIYPRDVEEVLLRHPAIAEAAVIGVPSERLGEEPLAFVVPRSGRPIDEEEVIAFARTTLAHYKVPRHIMVVDSLPRNGVGKVLKKTLREWASDSE